MPFLWLCCSVFTFLFTSVARASCCNEFSHVSQLFFLDWTYDLSSIPRPWGRLSLVWPEAHSWQYSANVVVFRLPSPIKTVSHLLLSLLPCFHLSHVFCAGPLNYRGIPARVLTGKVFPQNKKWDASSKLNGKQHRDLKKGDGHRGIRQYGQYIEGEVSYSILLSGWLWAR